MKDDKPPRAVGEMTLKQAQDEARRAGCVINRRGTIRYWLEQAAKAKQAGGVCS